MELGTVADFHPHEPANDAWTHPEGNSQAGEGGHDGATFGADDLATFLVIDR